MTDDLPEQTWHKVVDEWVAVDHVGVVVAGPFETQDEAWDALSGTYAENTGFAEPARGHETDWLEGGNNATANMPTLW